MSRSIAQAYADYDSAGAHKLLSDNRELYWAQSAATRDGIVAPFPAPEQPKREPKTQLRLFVFDNPTNSG